MTGYFLLSIFLGVSFEIVQGSDLKLELLKKEYRDDSELSQEDRDWFECLKNKQDKKTTQTPSPARSFGSANSLEEKNDTDPEQQQGLDQNMEKEASGIVRFFRSLFK